MDGFSVIYPKGPLSLDYGVNKDAMCMTMLSNNSLWRRKKVNKSGFENRRSSESWPTLRATERNCTHKLWTSRKAYLLFCLQNPIATIEQRAGYKQNPHKCIITTLHCLHASTYRLYMNVITTSPQLMVTFGVFSLHLRRGVYKKSVHKH